MGNFSFDILRAQPMGGGYAIREAGSRQLQALVPQKAEKGRTRQLHSTMRHYKRPATARNLARVLTQSSRVLGSVR
jgi:hypothetical protein